MSYAGVHFGLQGVEEHTLRHGRPPSPVRGIDDGDWLQSLLRTYRSDIGVDSLVIGETLQGSTSWMLSFYRGDKADCKTKKPILRKSQRK